MKNKFLLLLVVVLCSLAFSTKIVEAQTYYRFDDAEDQKQVAEGTTVSNDCGGIFTPEAIKIIQECLGYFRILAPAVLIIMIAVDLVQVLFSMEYSMPGGRDDTIRKATSKITKRIIAAVLLFFIPTIISIILNLDGVKDELQIPQDCIDVIN